MNVLRLVGVGSLTPAIAHRRSGGDGGAASRHSPTDTPEDVERALATERVDGFVAEVDGQVVGSIIAAFDGWRGHIYRLAVHPAFRRRGIARRLVDSAHESFARWGARRINALVEKDHGWAVSFWNAVGYVHDERIARFVKKGAAAGGGEL